MARIGARLRDQEATPVLEHFKRIINTETIAVGTAVLALPATNSSYRKAILIQNKSSNNLYVGGGEPYVFIGKSREWIDPARNKTGLVWKLSANGTNEWFCAVDDGDGTVSSPGLTQVRIFYYATIGGTETLATVGTVSSLAAEHGCGWGDGDTLGYSTVYVRTNGASPASNPQKRYETLIGYYFNMTASDSATTGGLKILPYGDAYIPLDGSGRIFGIGSNTNTYTTVLEVA